ncbi:MAG: nitroreductase [Pseudomonadota bacterium]
MSDALRSRLTVRGFLPDPVPEEVLRGLLAKAQRAPSGGNLQPWRTHVLTGAALNAFREDCVEKLTKGELEQETYPHYPSPLWEPQRSWRHKVGEDMYALLGIPRENKMDRLIWLANNARFFGAPVGIIITGNEKLGMAQHVDIGIYLQTVMLLAREAGLHTAPQGWWRNWPDTARKHLKFPDNELVLVGMSLGYGDPTQPVNDMVSDRASLEDVVHFYD